MLTSWGFWAGLADEDLCARLSNGSQSSDWLSYDRSGASFGCKALIERSFTSFAVAVHTFLYVLVLTLALKNWFAQVQRTKFAETVTKAVVAEIKQSGLIFSIPQGNH
jgi:hypothetical protein